MQQSPSSEQTYKNGYKVIMKRFIYIVAALTLSISMSAQTSDYLRRYNLLLDRVGPSGVGMETLINNWAKDYPVDADMLQARFYFYLSKAQSTEVITRSEGRYMGMSPVLSLKDSTGTDVHYYQLLKYDDPLFSEAVKALDSAISLYPERLDFRFLKANAYLSYERESPDMTLSNILGLVHEFMNSDIDWKYYGASASEPTLIDRDAFAKLIQEYCYSLYSLATPASYDAFLKLSQRMNEYYPKNTDFLGNLGSYYMVVKKDYKSAFRFYDKALKIKPDEVSIIKNAMYAARASKNVKLEKKYLKMLVRYADDEQTRLMAQGRLDGLNAK